MKTKPAPARGNPTKTAYTTHLAAGLLSSMQTGQRRTISISAADAADLSKKRTEAMIGHNEIKMLFAVLQARYGHRWTTAYDDPEIMRIAVSEWHRALKGFRPEDIRRGIGAVGDDWPPTLPMFVRACLPALSDLGYDVAAAVRRKAPKYRYEAHDAREEARREREARDAEAAVIREIGDEAIEEIADKGISTMLLEKPAEKKLLRKA